MSSFSERMSCVVAIFFKSAVESWVCNEASRRTMKAVAPNNCDNEREHNTASGDDDCHDFIGHARLSPYSLKPPLLSG